MYVEPKYFTPCPLKAESLYVPLEAAHTVADVIEVMHKQDFCLKAYSFGTGMPGYSESGSLSVERAPRPLLLLDKIPNYYLAPRVALSNAHARSLKDNGPKMTADGIISGVQATVVLSLAGAAFAGWSAAMVAKSALAGALYGAYCGGRERQNHDLYYARIQNTVMGLHDLLHLLHTKEGADWMYRPHAVYMQRWNNPEVFDQCTAELIAVGVDVPWAERYRPARKYFEQMQERPGLAESAEPTQETAAVAA